MQYIALSCSRKWSISVTQLHCSGVWTDLNKMNTTLYKDTVPWQQHNLQNELCFDLLSSQYNLLIPPMSSTSLNRGHWILQLFWDRKKTQFILNGSQLKKKKKKITYILGLLTFLYHHTFICAYTSLDYRKYGDFPLISKNVSNLIATRRVHSCKSAFTALLINLFKHCLL